MLAAVTTLALLLPQEADRPVARFQLAGRNAYVTADDLALELAARYHRTPSGRSAVTQMVDLHLVRQEATREGLMPTPEEVREMTRVLAEQMRAAGQDFETSLAERDISRRQFEDVLALGLAHRNLAAAAIGAEPDAVGEDMLALWLRQTRQRVGVVEDPDALPAGYAAKVGDRFLPLLELGRTLMSTTSAADRERFIQQIVVLRRLRKEAADRGITVTDDEARAEVQARREAAERDARYGGLRLEEVLQSQGMTLEGLARWPVLRAQILERKLVDLEHGPGGLRRMLEEQREEILQRHGPRRRLGILFVRALEEPNQLVPRDFADAEALLAEVRAQIRQGEVTFAAAVRTHSEEGNSKLRGGDTGWHRRAGGDLPAEVIEAGFALRRGGVSEPVRSSQGCFLIKLLDIEPIPSDEQLLRSLHLELEARLRQRILEEAAVELL